MLKQYFQGKQTIIAMIIVLLFFGAVIYYFLRNGKSEISTADIKRGDIMQTVSEAGQVQKEDKINLTFKNAGRVERVFVSVGDKVAAFSQLMKLETNDLYIKLQEAESSLAETKARLDKLLTGPTVEEIRVSQTKASNKEVLLAAANQNLDNEYQNALTVLDDAYLKAYNAKNAVDYTQRTYFNNVSDQEWTQINDAKIRISTAVSEIKSKVDLAAANDSRENIDSALLKTKGELSATADALAAARESCEAVAYRNIVSSTDKTALDTQRLNINTVLEDVVAAQQEIVSKKSAVAEASGNLQAAKDDLALLTAPARQEDVNLYKAQVQSAESQVRILEHQIQDAYLRSPVEGQVTDIKKKIGEFVQPSADAAVVLMPVIPFAIAVDIYEEDVVKIRIGNSVDISLVSFPDKIFIGEITSIDPAEKMIEGIVYYKTIISFNNAPEGLRPGMTADVIIKTDNRENALLIPESAIHKKEGKEFTEVLHGEGKETREIQTGLVGDDGMVEILSGLQEGEKIILP